MSVSERVFVQAASPPVATTKEPPKLKFDASDHFISELRRRVDEYFDRTGKRRRDCSSMYTKTAIVMTWMFGTYVLLVFFASSWLAAVPLAIVLGLAVAAVAFNVQHDGGHKAYSEHPWINTCMARVLDLLGGSSYMWERKHNAFHHTYTNIAGQDDDIDVGILGRLAPEQRRLPFHRFQGIYLWFLYGLLTIKWQLFDDFFDVIIGRVGSHKVARPRGKDLVVFFTGKAVFYTLAFVIPMLRHPVWKVLVIYGLAAFVTGVVLSVVFQLAHCTTESAFPVPVPAPPNGVRIENEWAIHQVQTTADFARGNRLLWWLLGGLNFQIEHHLFTRICHVHYPALSKIVEGACKEMGVRYAAHRTMLTAIAAHYRWLVQMGRPTV